MNWRGKATHFLGGLGISRGFRRLAVFTGLLGFLSFAFLLLVYGSDWMLSWFGWNYEPPHGDVLKGIIVRYDMVYAAVDVCFIGLLFTMLPALITLAAGWLIAFASWVIAGFRQAD